MGYLLSSLGALPVEDGVNLYIFIIGNGWASPENDVLERNFSKLAKNIGPNAIIAKGHEEEFWKNEVFEQYLGPSYKKLWEHLPAILLTDAHPKNLSDNSLRFLIPVNHIEKAYQRLDPFFEKLCAFARGENDDFLKHFEDQENWIDKGNELIELKPNFFGVGINLNEFVRRRRSRK